MLKPDCHSVPMDSYMRTNVQNMMYILEDALSCFVRVAVMSNDSDDWCPFGTPAEEDDACTMVPRTRSVAITDRPGGKPLYGNYPEKIRIDTPRGVLTFPALAHLLDVQGDGNCCFRVMAVVL